MRSEDFGIDIKLEANKLEAAGVYGEATLKVRIQYLCGGTFLGDGTQDELNNHDRGVAEPDTVDTGRGLSNLHAAREEWFFPSPQTLHNGQSRWNK